MPAPFTPDDAKLLISDPTSSLCGNFVKTLLRLPVLFWQLVSWLVDSNGNPISVAIAGDIIMSAAPLAETDHRKLCNGQELSKTTYAVLYAAIGDVYATMDGQAAPAAGNFRAPKYTGGRFPIPVGTFPSGAAVALGGIGGEEKVELDAINIPKHHHTTTGLNALTADSYGGSGGITTGTIAAEAPGVPEVDTDSAFGNPDDSTEPHNNVPPWFGVYFYIFTGI